ncbi:DUF4062 domain-containing protein [Spongiibacter tropicus]|uniref:DUF4062 domain-containing protein n=1 Tax=Spongiibacter tropicus TaxID=454602 RepID=UPI0023553393|nr:DUF4062 domain-containing protein [Spongiibacter tropicus]|tara:strand:- start:40624 stop:41601 length:978 start_codon:yes stop_codon:yes gene_type:complete
MDKKYQVFVSSTFSDLIDERQEVMQALLELDCIPVGMELFPAADDDQWTLIKGLIDDCDYYVLIQAGRYGSIGPDGKSYTQMEYEYALEKDIPIISFLHADISKIEAGKSESVAESIEKLNDFRELVQMKMCRFWSSPAELGSQVSRSLVKLIKSKPQTGWIRADIATSDEANAEIARLRKENDELKAQLNRARTTAPEGTNDLRQGDDPFELNFSYYYGGQHEGSVELTWNQCFYLLAPLMLDESTEAKLQKELEEYLKLQVDERPRNLTVNSVDFQTMKVQFVALGLITKSEKKRSIKDSGTYWSLTPFGETKMMQLRALRKE